MGESRIENILQAKSEGVPYDGVPQSRLEEELINTEFDKPVTVVSSFEEMTDPGLTYALLNTDDEEFNSYTEYRLINGKPERLGKQDIVVDAYTRAETDALLVPKANTSDVNTALARKVDTEAGKGLSSNDYTNSDKEKLSGIEEGADVSPVRSVNGQTGDVTIPGGSQQSTATKTLSASNWVTSGSDIYYNLATWYPLSSYNVQVAPHTTMTDAQLAAYSAANLVGDATHNRIHVRGTKPTIDIPVLITATTK